MEGEKFPGELYRFGETFPSQVLISHSGRRQMPLTGGESACFSFLNSQAWISLFRDDCQDSFTAIFSLRRSSSSPTRGTTRAPSGGAPANQQNTRGRRGGGGRLISVQFILKLDRIIMWCSHISANQCESRIIQWFQGHPPPVRKFEANPNRMFKNLLSSVSNHPNGCTTPRFPPARRCQSRRLKLST